MKALPIMIAGHALALAAIASPVAANAQERGMPAELIGVWSNDDGEGKKQCAAYRANPIPRQDGYDPQVGSVIITKALIHSYAEYGEGNFYKVDSVSRTGAKRWLVRSYLYLDVLPPDGPPKADPESAAYTGDTLTLKGKTLIWTGPEAETRTLFRCASLKGQR